MKKSAVAVILAALILCLAPVIISEYAKHQPITIKTSLPDGEVVPHVKLSDGELWFKTEDEVAGQLTAEDRRAAINDAFYFRVMGKFLPLTRFLNADSEDEMAALMNLHPELWRLPKGIINMISYYHPPVLYGWDDRDTVLTAETDIFLYFSDSAVPPSLSIRIGAGDYVDLSDGVSYYGGGRDIDFSSEVAHIVYGHRDSRIGDVDMSLLVQYDYYGTRRLRALFTIENAGYIVSATGITQREFIKLLISICEAPRENTQDVVEYILEHG